MPHLLIVVPADLLQQAVMVADAGHLAFLRRVLVLTVTVVLLTIDRREATGFAFDTLCPG
jgi:hypothetical protein